MFNHPSFLCVDKVVVNLLLPALVLSPRLIYYIGLAKILTLYPNHLHLINLIYMMHFRNEVSLLVSSSYQF